MQHLRVAILELYVSGDRFSGGQSGASSVARALQNHCWCVCPFSCDNHLHESLVTVELVTPEQVAEVKPLGEHLPPTLAASDKERERFEIDDP